MYFDFLKMFVILDIQITSYTLENHFMHITSDKIIDNKTVRRCS